MVKKKNNGIVDKIKEFFNNIVTFYKNLKPVWRSILNIWVIVLVVIILLIIICGSNNKMVSNHSSIEKAIKSATMEYVKDKELYGTIDKKLKITMDELIFEGYLSEDDVKDKTCSGYSLAYYEDDKYYVDSYLLCKNYVTEGYSVK